MPTAKKLETLVAEGRDLLNPGDENAAHYDFYRWDRNVAAWLDKIAPGSGLSAQWSALPGSNLCGGHHYFPGPDAWTMFRKAVRDRMRFLGDLASSFRKPDGRTNEAKADERDELKSSIVSRKVFIVHGRNEACRESVARFVEWLDLIAVILHEQPNAGRTLIEKFTHSSDVSFAVVLLTADDRGGLADESPEAYKPRARQNVILELGFFLAKLGRKNVCVLYKEGVEIPSDYQGMGFVKLDADGAWRLELAREMKQAHLPIDMNKAVLGPGEED